MEKLKCVEVIERQNTIRLMRRAIKKIVANMKYLEKITLFLFRRMNIYLKKKVK